jgi:hypothetical protein
VPLRDDRRLRALVVGAGVVRPRTARTDGEAALLAELARGRRRVVEIGVDEGAAAIVLCDVLDPGAELHLIDAFARQPGARRQGAAATEWATRRVVDRAAQRANGPRVQWHVDFSANVAAAWTLPVDLVSLDGDHSEIGVTKDWELWHPFVVEGGAVLFHGARDGLPGPTAVVDRLFRGPRSLPDWEIADEVDGAVAVRYAPRAA